MVFRFHKMESHRIKLETLPWLAQMEKRLPLKNILHSGLLKYDQRTLKRKMKCPEKQMTHSTQKCTVHLWQLLYGGIIPLEKTRSVSHPQKRKVNLYILLIQRWPICMRLFPRYSTRKWAHLLDLLAGASLFELEEENPLGASVGGRETESNLSRHTGCLPRRSRGIREPSPWNACSPFWRGCLTRRRASWELPLCSIHAPGDFSRDGRRSVKGKFQFSMATRTPLVQTL